MIWLIGGLLVVSLMLAFILTLTLRKRKSEELRDISLSEKRAKEDIEKYGHTGTVVMYELIHKESGKLVMRGTYGEINILLEKMHKKGLTTFSVFDLSKGLVNMNIVADLLKYEGIFELKVDIPD